MTNGLVRAICMLCALLAFSFVPASDTNAEVSKPTGSPRPNFLFVVFEDMGPRISAFGDKVATTPVLDAFAAQSVRFTNAFTTSGVCAPSRSSLITGVHQQTLGTQHMRTRSPSSLFPSGGPIAYDAVPPAQVKAFPEVLRAAGYYTTNNGKTDYQFGDPLTVWDDQEAEHPWRERPDGAPFFAMVNVLETHESAIWPTDIFSMDLLFNLVRLRNWSVLSSKENVTDPADVEVPPYLPDTPIVRADIARHYDNIAFSEKQLGQLLSNLEADGLADDTVVVVTTDHGDGLPRMKRAVYDSGIKVPLMVRFPDGRGAGTMRDALVSFVDIGPTFLSLAGIDPPGYSHGRPIFDHLLDEPRDYIVAGSDRFDAVPEHQRAIRDKRWKYIRNYRTDLPFFQPLTFRDHLPTMQELWRLHEEGALTATQAQYFESPRPAEELYDTLSDPHEVKNLAADPAHADTLARLRQAYDDFAHNHADLSMQPEIEMIETMWPDLEQAKTEPVAFSMSDGQLTIASGTPFASIAYQTNGDPRWRLYSSPIQVSLNTTITAKAVRYGYTESDEASYTHSP